MKSFNFKQKFWRLLGSITILVFPFVFLMVGLSLAKVMSGGNTTRVTTTEYYLVNRNPVINSNGTKLVFESDSNPLGQSIHSDQFEIWLYSTSTMTFTRITTASEGSRDSLCPDISANGQKIVFISDSDFLNQGIQSQQWEIWLYNTNTMTMTRVTTGVWTLNRQMGCPSINEDGSKITFMSDRDFLGQGVEEQQFQLWLYDTQQMTMTHLLNVAGNGRYSGGPRINADGTRIVFNSNYDFL